MKKLFLFMSWVMLILSGCADEDIIERNSPSFPFLGLFSFCAYVTILLKKNVAIKIDNSFFIIIHFFDY